MLRFAGPKLASSSDDLVPARLRAGDRILGGALSWSEPLALAPFPPDSPFAGLPVTDEVRVSRQVLAEPGPDLAAATMASLSDGTPLVTGARRGKGWLILVHTTANTAWTYLPLSGLFVQMLERLVALGPGVGGIERAPLEPSRLLDAFGRLDEPAAALDAIGPDDFAAAVPGPLHPPGLYAPVGRQGEGDLAARSALNLQRVLDELQPLSPAPSAARPNPTPAPPNATLHRGWCSPHCYSRWSISSSLSLCVGCSPAVRRFAPEPRHCCSHCSRQHQCRPRTAATTPGSSS